MRRPSIASALILLPLALAACNKQPSVSATNATTAEVRNQVAAASGDAPMVEPGRWEGTLTMHDIEMAGMANLPAAAKAQMQAEMKAPKPFISCVTPEDVKANKAFFTGDAEDERSCKYDHFTLAGGKIDAAMSCAHGEGAKMAMTMSGTYEPQAYHMDIASKTSGNTPMAMAMKMTIDAKRVGACRGTPDER